VMPFDNRVVGIRLTGAELREVLAKPVANSFGFPGLAGMRVRAECREGNVQLTLLRRDGSAVRDDEALVVATNDFIALGGDRILESVLPPGGFSFTHDAGLVHDAIVNALRGAGAALGEADLVDPATPRWELPSAQPVTCAA
jgi:2',3'-cyclic-nucleotide 2'-phosphodiesterase / 3'-nucleotidase / 5'-nucleotidase